MAFLFQNGITIRDLEEGDLIEFYRAMGTFSHWAVYVGHGQVIHLSPNPDDDTGKFNLADIKSATSVRMDNVKTVAGDSKTYRNNEFDDHFRPFSKAEIVRRAKKRLGRHEYDLLKNNCEHFATWCRYGKAMSKQVEAMGTKTIGWITPPLYRAWELGDMTTFLAPHLHNTIDKFNYSPPGDLVLL